MRRGKISHAAHTHIRGHSDRRCSSYDADGAAVIDGSDINVRLLYISLRAVSGQLEGCGRAYGSGDLATHNRFGLQPR